MTFFIDKNSISRILLVNFFIICSSLRFFYKYFNFYFLIVFVIVFNILFLSFYSVKLNKVYNYINWRLTSVIIAIASYVIWPYVDGRREMGKGSTADDAMIASAKSLLIDFKLYNIHLLNDVPISPGPGWVILNSPFVLLNLYSLMNPVYLFIVGLFLCYNFGKDYVNKYLIFFFCLPLFWELLLSGHDIISFSFALFLMSLFSYKYLLKKNSFYNMLFLGILLGVLCTARVVLIFYPFILAFFLFKYQKKNSILLLIISVLSCGLLHLYFYAVNSCYQPMHLFQRGEKNVGVFPIFLSVLVLGIVMIVLYLKSKKDIISWNRSIMICFIIIFFTISIGELVENKFVLNTWEGVNYLFPIFPFLCFDWLAIASEFSREKNMKNENIGLHSNL